MGKNKTIAFVVLCWCACVSGARVMGKLPAAEQVAEFGDRIKKVKALDGSSIIRGDQSALELIQETTDLLIDNLRTRSGKRKAARLMLWSTLVHEFAQNVETISEYESAARLDILNFIKRRLKAQFSLLDGERLKTREGEIRRTTLLALNRLVNDAVAQLIDRLLI